mmetsp:Transcript_23905/g.54409  ORF Transcript_23905/g.54409 Transcript_23905/m.54409 type:complete len:116 (+) Transcript_23905:710-1057(+)
MAREGPIKRRKTHVRAALDCGPRRTMQPKPTFPTIPRAQLSADHHEGASAAVSDENATAARRDDNATSDGAVHLDHVTVVKEEDIAPGTRVYIKRPAANGSGAPRELDIISVAKR